MPKVGMEPIRREALIKATIAEVGAAGSLDVTVSRIARRAGVSSALAHHYFGGKDDILLAAMRHILRLYRAEVTGRLNSAQGHAARLRGVIEGSFSPQNFGAEVVSAWMTFYVLALSSPEARRLLHAYHRRLRSTLLHDLRPLLGGEAEAAADRLAAMIDGAYLRAALGDGPPDGIAAAAHVLALLDKELQP